MSLQTGKLVSPSLLLLAVSVQPYSRDLPPWPNRLYVYATPSHATNIVPLDSSHSADLLFIHVLLETLVEVFPPLEQQRMANELEPWGEL